MNPTIDIKVTFDDSKFKDYFLQYIQYKQGLGFGYKRPVQYCLSRLNTKLIELNTDKLDRDTVEKLIERRPGEAPATQLKRTSLLRNFAQFLNDVGIEAYIAPESYNVKWIDTFSPYIFNHKQIKSIFMAADSLPAKATSSQYHLVWPLFIRVLYGCGLRLSEALSLKTVDVDLEEGILYIEKSKKGTSRYAPMSVTLTEYCRNYAEAMQIERQLYFFPAPGGGKYHSNTAYQRIKDIYEKACIPRLSNGLLPRVHDLRHTFCCHALEQMQAANLDLYYALPILSTYIGHQGVRDTEQYLRLPAFSYSSIVDAELNSLKGIVPEVGCHER
jgi:integrase